jgi:Domain of unknown function (DUF4082)
MQTVQANQKEMERKPCIRRERGLSSVAAIVMKTCCSVVALVAVMVGMPFRSMADLPLVYDVENTGTNFPAPPLPTLANLPTILPLPDPFAWANDPINAGGTRSTNFTDWSHHRAEIKAQIENYEIGYKPPVDLTNIFASYAGSASSGTLTVRVTNVVAGTNRILTLTCAIAIPAGTGPVPAIIGMNSPNGSISLGGRAIATINYQHNQVTTYGSPANTNPYYVMYGAPYSPALNIDNTGQYSAWAWGVSRIIDGLYKLNGMLGTRQINLQRIGVTGCSYAGKMALFCGAFDERIALTIPQESGGGGAPNWRYSWQNETAGSVEGLGQTDHNWFSEGMFAFAGDNTAKLPEDHHELLAMVAPRALFATGNPDGAFWLSNPSCYVSCKAVEQVYNTFGISDRLGWNINGGKPHCALTADVTSDVGAFLDKFLLGLTNVNTITNRHVPSTYSTIDYARWYQWWGTANPIFPYIGKLSLSLPAVTPTEGDAPLVGQGVVSVTPTPTNVPVVVNLTSSNTNKVTVPASVVIPVGESNAVFDLTIVDNSLLDGDQLVTITGSSPVCNNGPQGKQITVHDNETATLFVNLPASVSESAANTFNGTVGVVGAAVGASVRVTLTCSDASWLQLGTVSILNGQTQAVFQMYVVDKTVIGGSTNVSVNAHVANWTDGATSMTILFDDLLPALSHFAWNPVPSSQLIGEPFPVTITAKDGANNTLDYRLPATLSALIPGNAAGTNTILNSPSPEQSAADGSDYVRGYSFTPGTNLKVTDVRHYFGDKVSIWTADGQLLASQNVVSVPGTWVDTPLPAPLVLPAGATYLVMVHESGQYFWSQSLPATFPDGTINQSWWDYGDVFPTQTDTADWYFVDLGYATDFVSVPVNPGATANFLSGTWSGNLAVLQAGTSVMLQASAGAGHSGTSAPFNVLDTPKLAIAMVGNSVVLSWPAAAVGFNLEQASTLSNWSASSATPVVVGDRYNATNTLSADPMYFRLRKP